MLTDYNGEALTGEFMSQEQEPINNALISVLTLKNEALHYRITPSIAEAERFILFLCDKFALSKPSDLIINIQDTSPNAKGFFMPDLHAKHYEAQAEPQSDATPLNYICLSSLHLKNEPYETIAHEFAHYQERIKGHITKGNYHSKKFKIEAERFLLKVEKGKYGFNQTEQTPEFLALIQEFIPNQDAFKIFQNYKDRKKSKGRNLLFICGCGCKIRTAKNENKPLKAVCLYCKSEFKEQSSENESEQDAEAQND